MAGTHPIALLAGTQESGILRSADGGDTWQASNQGFSNRPLLTLRVSPDFARDRMLVAGTAAEGVLSSTDGGASWTPLGSGLPSP
ncbi:MAG: hypothetical protein IH969_10195, partial [Candidatus Krumholzibacteriota bacterium]|nr:hypothetical protein [Candidatus Krumholzibacteriota bacterium]